MQIVFQSTPPVRGAVTFTAGKPEEVRALYQAVKDRGYKPAQKLAALMRPRLI